MPNRISSDSPSFGKILLFSITMGLTSVLQLLFNTADAIIVGKYCGSASLAAIGATTALTTVIINMSMGLAVGVNVVISRYIGAGNKNGISRGIHSTYLLGLLWGLFILFMGILFSVPMLRLINTPEDILEKAALYIRIYFCGVPFLLLYNFCAAILRAHGDTQHSLIFLTVSGIVNVLLNFFFVIILHMDVAGVAIATIISQALSLLLITCHLVSHDMLHIKELRIDLPLTGEIIRIGLPACLQSFTFGIANITIQGSVNSFGSMAVAAHTAASTLSNYAYQPINAVYHASLTFISRQMGTKNYPEIRRIVLRCIGTVLLIGIPLCVSMHVFGRPLLSLFVAKTESSYAQIIQTGMIYSLYITLTYFLCGVMEVMCGSLRGLGHSWSAMMITILCVCAFRILWIVFVFPLSQTLGCIYLSFPTSWIFAAIVYILAFLYEYRKLLKTAPDGLSTKAY